LEKRVSEESSNNPLRVLKLLGANPFITIKGVADKLANAFTTAQRAIERLERANIVKRVGDAKRDRVDCATALLDILEEPARLKPVAQKSLSGLTRRALETGQAKTESLSDS
jgi:DNA-binding MarR family transcriptional regulator